MLRRWQCHKIVEAEPITSFTDTITNKSVTTGEGINAYRHEVPENFFGRGKPEIGDYLVRYDTGKDTEYLSWSPKKAFEEGYTAILADAPIEPGEWYETLPGETLQEAANRIAREEGERRHKAELDAAVERLASIEPPARDKLVRFLVARIAKFEEGYDASDALRMEELSWLLLQAVGGNIV